MPTAAQNHLYRERQGYFQFGPGLVGVTCWCEANVVPVPVEQVGISTESCGRPGCIPPVPVGDTDRPAAPTGALSTKEK